MRSKYSQFSDALTINTMFWCVYTMNWFKPRLNIRLSVFYKGSTPRLKLLFSRSSVYGVSVL